MPFPVFQVPYLGNGMVIGLDGVVHVLISHGVAIGAFALLVLADWAAVTVFSNRQQEWDAFNRTFLRTVVVTVTVAGAVTGAGIWFTTGALAPRAVASMLRVFFWAWFAEGLVFLSEVVVLLAIWFGWDRLGRRRGLRTAVGLGYVALAGASAFLITGVLGFMLTPGAWLHERSLANAFFNPTFLPQLIARLALALTIGSVLAIGLVLLRRPDPVMRRQALLLFGGALATALPVLAGALAAYVSVVAPVDVGRSMFAVLTSHLSQAPWVFVAANAVAAALLAALAALALSGRWRAARWLLIPVLVAVAGVTAELERVREFIRGPYLMPGHMYANQLLTEERYLYARDGLLPASPWYGVRPDRGAAYGAGAFLFAQNCASCHTIGGLNDIRDRVRGRSEDGLYVILGRTHEMIGFMPSFSGTDTERRVLARFLFQLGRDEVRMQSLARLLPAPPEVQP